jgi:hypothetical protein
MIVSLYFSLHYAEGPSLRIINQDRTLSEIQ